jgi:glycosyltransferase involved in cell wall biosynthesis
MRVLLLSTYFWPEETGPAPYVTEPARFLAQRGHEVQVWTGFAHYPAWRPMQRRRLAARDELDGLDVRRRWHYIPRTQNALKRAAYEGSLLLGSVTALAAARRPDVVMAITPTLSSAVAGAAAATRFRVPFGLVVHDLMGRAAAQSGIAGGRSVARAAGRIELAAARRADRVGVIADGFRTYLLEAGIPRERVVRLRTWTLGSSGSVPRETIRARLGWDPDDFIVLHGGNMGQKQGLDNVIDTAAVLLGDRGIRIVLAGDGNDRANLERRARAHRVGNVQFLPSQPWGHYEAMLEAADVLLVNQRATVGDMSLPSKLTSYFAAGRPIVAAVASESETAREVQRSQAGIVVAPEDPPALARAVLRLRDEAELRSSLGAAGRRYAQEWLGASTALPEYEAFLRALCG